MGGSSSQTIGQRYFAKLSTFIGNPIEKLIGINFDNRGWIFKPDNDESFLRVESPNLYGDKEGGVAGFIDIHTGTADQLPNATYEKDFPKVSGYPFQSYLVFRGLGKEVSSGGVFGGIAGIIAKRHHYNKSFYHGNSGYMKEMLLWPKRIHVKNDGSAQWYDEKAEIPEISYISNGASWSELPISLSLNCRWGGSSIGGTDVSGTANIGTASFPLFEGETSYQVRFLGSGEIANGGPVGAEPSLYASSIFVQEKGMIPVNEKKGTALPPTRWKTNAMPHYDGYGNGPIVRQFFGSGFFYWAGGEFRYKIATSSNGASVQLLKDNTAIFNFGLDTLSQDWLFTEGYLMLEAGLYEVRYEAGLRYTGYAKARPLIHFTAQVILNDRIDPGDINPIHKIREILTDDTAMNKPESDVNDVNFMKAADRIFNEGLGISWSVTEKSCLEAINELCGHIEAGVRMNRQTGLYEIVLFRDDWFGENEIHTLPVNKIKSMNLDGAVSANELINKLNVSYYNREAIKNSSFSIAENAAIRNLNGHENSDEVKFPYFMNQRNAAVVTQWKLKQMSTPVWQGTFTTGFYEARKWNRYDLLRLEWPRKWAGTILVRIMKINLGTGTDVSIDFVEVVPFSSELLSNVVVDDKIDTTPLPPQSAVFKAFELSYLEAVQLNGQKAVDDALAYNPDAGYAAVIAKKPQDNSLSALMYTDTGNDFERVGTIAYCETAELDQNISQISSAFIVKDAGDIDMVSTGTQITVNNEIMVYQSYDEQTGLLTVKRGALDTVPQNHLAGSVLYFADDFITADPTEYVTGEVIDVKALTTTPSGILSLDDVDAQQVEIQARAIRPYPPANVKINSLYSPEEVSGNPVLTWVNRNRFQQTGGGILGWFEGGVALEVSVSYQLIVTTIDASNVESAFLNVNVGTVNTYTIDLSTAPSSVKQFKIVLKSVRDSYESMQHFEHIFVRPLTAPTNLTATYNA